MQHHLCTPRARHWLVALIWALLCVLLLPLSGWAAPEDVLPEKHLALVIGISSYAHWPALPGAVGDARQIADLLESGGFKTRLVVDPDSQTLKMTWKQFAVAANAKQDSACLVYYVGRAATLVDAPGTESGWIIPTDAPLVQTSGDTFRQKALRVQDLISDGAGLRVRHQLFLFDAAFGDAWLALQKPPLRLLSAASGSATRQVIISGRATDRAPAKNIFTDALIKALCGEADAIQDGIVTATELAVYLINHIGRTTGGRQSPQYALSGDAALAKGDFGFKAMSAKPRRSRLYVDTQPKEATIRILNIGPRFSQGIALEPGRYHLEVSADGHRQHKEWITLAAGEIKSVAVRLDQVVMQFGNSLGMQFRLIPAGNFQMGSRNASSLATQDETAHRVSLSHPFYMQTGEVTVGQYRRFVEASGYQSEVPASGGCWTSADGRRWRKQANTTWETIAKSWAETAGADTLPVSCIAWPDARAFARWLSRKEGRSYRLPTEAQWEYACRAGKTTAFAFGECLSTEQANFGGVTPSEPHCPMDTAPPRHYLVATHSLTDNAWGLFHMHGNVAEWCRDFYGPYPQKASRDPLGPAYGTERVIRGGHYLSFMNDCRSAKRSSFPPQYASSAVGFRLTAAVE